ncbi:MAG: hypothetical protein KIT79_11695 [Deltaproteobacteria bacterium]|nr:hypothetical protein [Deltaproteobacteria bacterium]
MMDSNHHKQSQRLGNSLHDCPAESVESAISDGYKYVNPPTSSDIQAGGGLDSGQNTEIEAAVTTLLVVLTEATKVFWNALERGESFEAAKGEFQAVMAKRGW